MLLDLVICLTLGVTEDPCEPISTEPFVTLEVIKAGRNENQSYSPGVVVLVTCGKGYGLNIGFNTTAKCARGLWKPDYPECEICE